nr:hypothetical protein Iba_chr10eCG5360 [Ipomoea batatas]
MRVSKSDEVWGLECGEREETIDGVWQAKARLEDCKPDMGHQKSPKVEPRKTTCSSSSDDDDLFQQQAEPQRTEREAVTGRIGGGGGSGGVKFGGLG